MGVADARTTEPETESLSQKRRRFTVAEYHRMIDAGILGEDEHVELLEGEILEMSPQEKPHARALSKLNGRFGRFLTSAHAIRIQLPLTLADSEPEPDLAIVREDDEAAASRHPSTALLVVEIANTSVRYDLNVKARLYAQASIPEYWLIVVPKHAVEVLRDPDAKGGGYRSRTTLTTSETLSPVAFPGLVIPVGSLFD
jgi:Uma2 family endonuclease